MPFRARQLGELGVEVLKTPLGLKNLLRAF
jgi:hypothetical protein